MFDNLCMCLIRFHIQYLSILLNHNLKMKKKLLFINPKGKYILSPQEHTKDLNLKSHPKDYR